ncbi:hypothetical protein ACFO25_04360 [Paenactinomyces guangxiensis]|uniref:Uncharacterized protein n=1 Tax=Paenactinomyces guangxiensis TaxID=1490290 RepID=A0A7W1WPD7_9BACL|nr:hypothetical protein [Paenactinomyces guangxiensis]MBA4493611.1 hypothetical protein [Paenactinomyces guangxiensis]MBH8590898.1 hypothetical protein [Paenactinomyces guangxiensis]
MFKKTCKILLASLAIIAAVAAYSSTAVQPSINIAGNPGNSQPGGL